MLKFPVLLVRFLILAMLLNSPWQLLTGQKLTVAQMKAGIEKSANPVAYVREVLKKKYKIDTIYITNTTYFSGISDSLAYKAKQGKVYGPIERKYLVQVLGRAPNNFTKISQVYLDTSLFTRRIADSLANSIIERIEGGQATFEDMALTYSMGGEATLKGDLGWIARGSLVPEIEKAIASHKKGEIFKVWSRSGVHVIKKQSDPKQDTGFALMLRVIL